MSLFPDLPPSVSLQRQIEGVEREIAFRVRVYERWIEQGRITRKKADEEVGVMRAVLETVKRYHKLSLGPSTDADIFFTGVICGLSSQNIFLTGADMDRAIDEERGR